MSKFLSEKKKLIEDVFDKASRESPETSFNGILLHIEQVLKDDFEPLSYKTFENYYKALVENDEDYKIKTSILDNLSRYLGFESFGDYCSGWKSFEYKISQAMSRLVITVINKPIFQIPEFFTKQSNLGILSVLILCGAFAGNKILGEEKDKKVEDTQSIRLVMQDLPKVSNQQEKINYQPVFISSPPLKTEVKTVSKECMYWNGEKYIREYCDAIGRDLIAYSRNIAGMQKIKRPDTLTVENAFGHVWYDKIDNEVTFFNSYGENPENKRTLKKATKHIIIKYGKQEIPE